MSPTRQKLIVSTLLMGILFFPGFAKAQSWSDDFNDNVMDSQWAYLKFGSGSDKINLFEQGGVLNFEAIGLGPAEEANAGYVSNVMPVDFNNDFWANIQFFNHYEGINDNSLGIGLFREDSNVFLAAGREDLGKRFWSSIGLPGQLVGYQGVDRNIDAGWLRMKYTKDGDLLEFNAADLNGGLVFTSQYPNFTTIVGQEPMNVIIGGGVKGGDLAANLDNFSGGIAPEPISSALFMLGAAAMALFKRKN